VLSLIRYFSPPNVTDLEDVVIDIKLYNGTVDVLIHEGELNNGEDLLR
jgi:hypothetical protein